MSSACINPVLYGFLNDTFKQEFTKISEKCCFFFYKTNIPAITIEEIEALEQDNEIVEIPKEISNGELVTVNSLGD